MPLIGNQSAKTTQTDGEHDFDGGKQVNERKHHILVDTVGNLLEVVVHVVYIASIQTMLKRPAPA